jgi:hypothetical protein
VLLIESDFSDMHNQWALFILSGETRNALRRTVFGGKNSFPQFTINQNVKTMKVKSSMTTSGDPAMRIV